MEKIDAAPLLPDLLHNLIDLLRELDSSEWDAPTACPGWSVHDLASHLLGVELGNVSLRRDSWHLKPGPGEDPDLWLNRFNNDWVQACRRLSPRILISLLESAGTELIAHVLTLDLEELGAAVEWATGSNPAPVWLDVAREYMERYVHQHQIREATSRSPLGPRFLGPVLETAVYSLPFALRHVQRPSGTTLSLEAVGPGGGTWFAVSAGDHWEMRITPEAPLATTVSTTAVGALKLFVRDPSAPRPSVSGDKVLAEAVVEAKAVLG